MKKEFNLLGQLQAAIQNMKFLLISIVTFLVFPIKIEGQRMDPKRFFS